MHRGGSLARSVAIPRLHEEWRKHHAFVPANTHLNSGGLRPPQTSAQLTRIDPGPSKGFGDGTDVFFVVAPRCRTVEITWHQVKHHSTNCDDKLLSNVTFLVVNVTNV